MSKNVLVISTSLRGGSNSDILADEFVRGAQEAGNKAEKISLRGKKINFCIGCLACQQTGRCVLNDDVAEILPKMQQADVICFASPVYFYDMCGQLKTFLDHTNPLFPSEYKFRDIYVLLTAADTEETAADGPLKGLQGWIDCFENASLKGVVCGLGAEKPGDARHLPAMADAYEFGKNV